MEIELQYRIMYIIQYHVQNKISGGDQLNLQWIKPGLKVSAPYQHIFHNSVFKYMYMHCEECQRDVITYCGCKMKCLAYNVV